MKWGILAFLFIVSSLAYGEERFLVGFAQDTLDNDWRAAQVREVQEEFRKYPNIDFIYTDAEGDFAKQVFNIESLLEKKIDLLIASPKDAKAMTPIIKKVFDAKIPVVLLSRRIEGESFTTYIHPDNYEIGKASGEFIAKRLGEKGSVLILQHTPTSTPAIGRTDGFMEAIKKYPNINVVGMKVANSLRSEAIAQTEAAINEGLRFDAIYAQSDSMAAGARIALKKNGIDPKSIVITGIDYISEAKEAILLGEQSASFVYQTAGAEGAKAAINILRGKKVPKETVLKTQLVTKENASRIKPIF